MVPCDLIGLTGILLMVVGTLYGVVKAYDDIGSQARLSNYESLSVREHGFPRHGAFCVQYCGGYVGRIYLLLNRDPSSWFANAYR